MQWHLHRKAKRLFCLEHGMKNILKWVSYISEILRASKIIKKKSESL